VPFLRQCRKNFWSQRGHKWRHNLAQTPCMQDKQGYIRARTCTHPCTHTHLRRSARTYTNKYKTLTVFPRRQWFANAPQCDIIRTLPALAITAATDDSFTHSGCYIMQLKQFLQPVNIPYSYTCEVYFNSKARRNVLSVALCLPHCSLVHRSEFSLTLSFS
jgi:hypothetical protein